MDREPEIFNDILRIIRCLRKEGFSMEYLTDRVKVAVTPNEYYDMIEYRSGFACHGWEGHLNTANKTPRYRGFELVVDSKLERKLNG